MRRVLRRDSFRGSVQKLADAIPAGRDTVYRLLKGETENPTRAVRAGIERLIGEEPED